MNKKKGDKDSDNDLHDYLNEQDKTDLKRHGQ